MSLYEPVFELVAADAVEVALPDPADFAAELAGVELSVILEAGVSDAELVLPAGALELD